MKPFDIASLLNITKLPDYIDLVEKELANLVPKGNPHLVDPVNRLIKARSKRLRPSLLIGIVVNQGGEVDQKVISSCLAIELVHLASLVHDDIIDEAKTRWGVPTINENEGINAAIIIGDYLFAEANIQAANVSPEVVQIVSSTIKKLCEGEMYEMTDEFDPDRSMASLIKTMEGKTAALISATCQVGGICAGLPRPEITALYNYGVSFGISFQIIDDLLDLLSNDKLLGKPTGNDIKEGVFTLPVLLAAAGSMGPVIKNDLRSPATLDNSSFIYKLFECGAIKKSIATVRGYNKLAIDALLEIKDEETRRGLTEVADHYLYWSLNNLVDDKYKKKISKYI